MASSDDGVREINLSGKQLVFLFMTATVVSVVIFLCGVLVGRGVQQKVTSGTATVPAIEDAPGETAVDASPSPAPSEPTKAAGLEYPERLESSGPSPEQLTPRDTVTKDSPRESAPATSPSPAGAAQSSPTPAPPAAQVPAPAPPAGAAPALPDATPLPPEPKGDGFAIQVTALKGRGEAADVVARLKQKGYSAYLLPPLAGQPSVYRVRVGKFKARAEAEQVATRLEREEQFKPWITR